MQPVLILVSQTPSFVIGISIYVPGRLSQRYTSLLLGREVFNKHHHQEGCPWDTLHWDTEVTNKHHHQEGRPWDTLHWDTEVTNKHHHQEGRPWDTLHSDT